MIKKLLLTLAFALAVNGVAMATENTPLPVEQETPAVAAAPAEETTVLFGQNSPLFTAKATQRATCATECRDEFNACRAACTDRTCVGECADALDVCLALCC